ncbi:aspartate aminotransferase family protein [Acerihabitans arboris]|uniref:Aminotransferase class III-fold pyridoxal phosphate-dependent enzyme n=1 Tax=Acerihabitans arboris TaxID=2691583 RepID=A0A845SJG2_9GAMM|nr:aminotransferase class III-fold pyridoxal phosphate-dependent enzyme [Acerihabitans arboris]NDL63397.1 aminotransferase class III-fold pyridoxal phosphate-dependent enzyme [Acerihabitans arboris]
MQNDYAISHALHKRASNIIPGGISSNNRANWRPHPLFYKKAQGAHVWDADGNRYLDYVLGRGPLITGHSNPRILDAINRQYQAGQFFAGQTELEVVLAEKIRHLVPGAEMIRFCNSGSEAIHVALRLARSATGREKIIRFEGHYHGWFDNIAWGFSAPEGAVQGNVAQPGDLHENSVPVNNAHGNDVDGNNSRQDNTPIAMSQGQPAGDARNIISLCWNDGDALERVLSSRAHEVAAVVTEPIMFNSFWSNIRPEENYLTRIKTLCDKYHILLIFDEIQTGFRTALGGAQGYYGVTPDITTFAKAMGGPVCLAAVAGKERHMRLLAGAGTLHTGTYNAFPPFLAGAIMNLDILAENGGEALNKIHLLSEALRAGLQDIAGGTALSMQVRASPGAVTTTFRATPAVARDYRTARDGVNQPLVIGWHAALQERGVRITPEGLWYVSTAHSVADIDYTLEQAAAAVRDLEQAGRES